MTRIAKFFRRTPRERMLWLEALLALCWAKLLVQIVPFRRLAPRLGVPQSETVGLLSPEHHRTSLEISWAVQAAARHVPLGFVCLPQALAARRMLSTRGIASTLYFGVAPGSKDPGDIESHAWLRAGAKIVTGEREALRHVVVAKFASTAR